MFLWDFLHFRFRHDRNKHQVVALCPILASATCFSASWLLPFMTNTKLMGTPNSVIQPLQKIENFAARLVLLAPHHHHSTPLLEKLHWLPISECVKYKVACFSVINGSGPAYPSELLHVYTLSHTLRSSSDTRMLEIQQYKRKTHGFRTSSLALDPTFGIHSHKTLDTAQPCHLLKPNCKPSSSHGISILTNKYPVSATVNACVCV